MSKTLETRFVSAGGREVAYDMPNEVPGPGHVVVLVHGSSFDRRIWSETVEQLAVDNTPIAVDSPSHGDSSGPPVRSVDEAVTHLQRVIEALEISRFVLIGHSLGGAIAQRYYALHSDQLDGIGLVSTAPHFGLTDEVVSHWRESPDEYRAEELSLVVAPSTSEEIRAGLLSARDRIRPEGQDADLEACFLWDNRDNDYLKFDVPLLAVTGDCDIEACRNATLAWVDANDGATLLDVKAASHMMMVEQPAETAKGVVDWVNSL